MPFKYKQEIIFKRHFKILMKTFLATFLLTTVFACQLQTEPPATNSATGKVVSIADGDTFTYLTPDNQQVKVRLFGIDCPEKKQDFGTVARQKLSELVFGQAVKVVQKDKDRYGRTVAIVYNAKGMNVNEQMLAEGMAWHYTQYDKNPRWNELEKAARAQRKGLWASPNPTPPWLWRKASRETQVQ